MLNKLSRRRLTITVRQRTTGKQVSVSATVGKTFEEIVPGPLRDIQDKLAKGFGDTLNETAGIEPPPERPTSDWSDLD